MTTPKPDYPTPDENTPDAEQALAVALHQQRIENDERNFALESLGPDASENEVEEFMARRRIDQQQDAARQQVRAGDPLMATPKPDYPTPDENTPNAHLLDMIDDSLRNGGAMTRANLCFDLLCQRLGYDRDEFPTFLSWYDAEERR